MKILIFDPLSPQGAFHRWMTADLQALGHEVTAFDPDEPCGEHGIEIYRRVLIQEIARRCPDLLIVYPPYDLLRAQERERIHALRTAIVGFAYDDPIYMPAYLGVHGQFERVLEQYRRTYDVYVTTSRQFAREAAARGHDWVHSIRWAVNTPTLPVNEQRNLPLVLVGTAYPRRVEMVRALRKAGIQPLLFGMSEWQQFPDVADLYRGVPSRESMFDVYRRAQIALAPADWEWDYSPMVKLRTLEIASCGAFQLVERSEDLADYYREGEEIVSYTSWDQLIELIRRYQADPAARQRIARANFDRTVRDHVWKVRWGELEALARPALEQIRAGGAGAGAAAGAADPALSYEMTLSASGAYHEQRDPDSALAAYSEWEKINAGDFNLLLGKGRALFCQRRFAESEPYLRRALDRGQDLCNLGIDATFSTRKLGSRIGLGRLFSGIFPRTIECYAHLLMVYAMLKRTAELDALLRELAANQDVLAASILAVVSDSALQKLLAPGDLLRFVDVVLQSRAAVYAPQVRSAGVNLLILRGRALAALGRKQEARQAYGQALAQRPPAQMAAQIQKEMGAMG